MNELFRRLRYLLLRRRFDDELANDMEFHREMNARAGGGQAFGNTLRLREEARDAWGWTWIDRVAQDLRYAFRLLRKSPGFTLAAVMMLAIGIGVNVAAFGFFNLVMLRSLPVRDPDTLLRFERRSPEAYASELPFAEMDFLRQHTTTLSAVLALRDTGLRIQGEEKALNAHFVTTNFFTELGASAQLGRTLDPARDEVPGAEAVAVLSQGFWQRHFGSDPAIVGKTIRLNDKPLTVVGVAVKQFSGLTLDSPDLWLPIRQQPYFVPGSQLLTELSSETSGVSMWGRLRPGMTPKAAEEELKSLAAQLRTQHPDDIWEHESLPSEPGGYSRSSAGKFSRGSGAKPPDERVRVIAMVGALGLLILAVACGNLGSLLLARGVARGPEISLRVAIGAGSGRLIRQLFTESLLLALLGAAAGLGLGYIVLRGLMVWTDAPIWLDVSPDWRVVAFAVGAGFAAALLFGLTPALQIARQRQRATAVRQLLIAAQVAGSCVLLIVASLLVRATERAMFVNPGFEYERIVTIRPNLVAHGYEPGPAQAYMDTLLGRVRGLPGVASASLASTVPLGNRRTVLQVEIDGRRLDVHVSKVDPQFFQTMQIPLLRGRDLVRGEKEAMVVSESLAQRRWPNEDPIGKRFQTGVDDAGAPIGFTVVGVSSSARTVAREDVEAVEGYFPADRAEMASMSLVVRTSAPPEDLAASMSSIAKSLDPTILPEVDLMKRSFRKKLESVERSAAAVSLLSVSALLLACVGIVGLVAFAVSQRTKEIGIRIALGAKRTHVIGVVLRQFSRPVLFGLLAGVIGAGLVTQLLRRELYGVSHLDPMAYLAAIGVFIVTATLAALLPARKALRIDPLRALRHE